MPRPSRTVRGFEPPDALSIAEDPKGYLEHLFCCFLQNLYRDAPEGYGLTWRPNEEETDLVITTEKPTGEQISAKPYICVVLGPYRFSGTGGIDLLQSQNMATGERKHTDLMPGTVSYHCTASSGAHAGRMAGDAARRTVQLKRLLTRIGGLFKIGLPQITGETEPGYLTGPLASDEVVAVVATIPIFWQEQWLISRNGLSVLQRIATTMGLYEAHAKVSAGRVARVRAPSIRGRVVQTAPLGTPLDPPGVAYQQVVISGESRTEDE